MEATGRGHFVGVTHAILQNQDQWAGEGDEMMFIDDNTKPVITGTGTEDYYNGAWDFGGRTAGVPFGYPMHGAPSMLDPEVAGGRTSLYRWHIDNPVCFQKSFQDDHGAWACKCAIGLLVHDCLLVPDGTAYAFSEASCCRGQNSTYGSGRWTRSEEYILVTFAIVEVDDNKISLFYIAAEQAPKSYMPIAARPSQCGESELSKFASHTDGMDLGNLEETIIHFKIF